MCVLNSFVEYVLFCFKTCFLQQTAKCFAEHNTSQILANPDVTCFIILLFTAQHVSNVSTSIFSSLRIIVGLFHNKSQGPEDGFTDIRNMLSSK